MPRKQQQSPAPAGSHVSSGPEILLVTAGEAAMIKAYRSAEGVPDIPPLPLDAYHHLLSSLMEHYRDAMVDKLVSEAPIRAKMVLVERMINLKQTA